MALPYLKNNKTYIELSRNSQGIHCFVFQTTETYNTFASFEASTEGTYFVSVVAVNRAKENSNVVCSDGVTIMTTMPYIQDFVMSGAKTRPRLIRDNDGNVWFLDNILQRHFVENITSSCM